MEIVVVYKADGTIQCDETSEPIPIEHHAAELRRIGASEILGQGNVPGPAIVITLCGTPTGRVNAYAILKIDWDAIVSGIVGTLGFRLWSGAPLPDLGCKEEQVVGGDGPGNSICTQPILVRELMGRPCRCYRQGDSITKDFVPERVNIEHDEAGRVSDIWFG